jgi:hypothetical protein
VGGAERDVLVFDEFERVFTLDLPEDTDLLFDLETFLELLLNLLI